MSKEKKDSGESNYFIYVFEWIFPFLNLHRASKKLNIKIKSLLNDDEYNLEYTNNYKEIELCILEKDLNDTLKSKLVLEDKAKSSLVAITISATIMFSIVQVLQNLHGSNTWLILISILSFISMIYMVIAGCISLYSISDMNIISKLTPNDSILNNEEKKLLLAESIELNYLYNTKRNNLMSTSYRCIITSIAVLITVFCFSSIYAIITNPNNSQIDIDKKLIIEEHNENINVLVNNKDTIDAISIRLDEILDDIDYFDKEIVEINEIVNKLSEIQADINDNNDIITSDIDDITSRLIEIERKQTEELK